MDRIRLMQVFARVVEAGSFAGAARSLSIPRSTVSRSVQELEAALGASLLQRTTRKLSLTPKGSLYYEHCLHVLGEVDAIEAALSDGAASPRGRLRVDMTSSFARALVLPRLGAFLARYPDLELVLTLGDRPVDLVQEGVDCVVRAGTPQSSALLVARPLGSFDWITCASPSYLERHGMPRDLDDLARHRLVEFHAGRTGRPIDWRFHDGKGERVIGAHGRLAVDDTDAYLGCGLEGLGVIRVASYLAAPYLASGRLVQVLPGSGAAPVPLCALYPRNRYLAPGVRAFVDWIGEVVRDAGMRGGKEGHTAPG